MERLNNSQKHFDLYGWHALKGQKLLAQDCYGPQAARPERAYWVISTVQVETFCGKNTANILIFCCVFTANFVYHY